MGCCVSIALVVGADFAPEPSPTAKVISVNGDLREYNLPATTSEVLDAEAASSSSSSSSSSSFKSKHFVCNSDSLYYDDFIPAMKLEEQLQANQIYFVLPDSKRRSSLSASDMAALAVKASVALQSAAGKESRRRRKRRISPVMIPNQSEDLVAIGSGVVESTYNEKYVTKMPPRMAPRVSRSGSVRKLQRYASRRTKMAVRSFRLRLSTIYEGSVL